MGQGAKDFSTWLPEAPQLTEYCAGIYSKALILLSTTRVAPTPQTFGSHSTRGTTPLQIPPIPPRPTPFRDRCSTACFAPPGSLFRLLPSQPCHTTLSPPPSRPPPPSRHLLKLFGVPCNKHDLLPGQGRHGDPQLQQTTKSFCSG